ncbi:hypothetical protein IU500_07010 [Nocardia terpenica]|uniref:DNA polymerase III subunit beta n=1 Tax=Nocardia terpenica TaxID=455432 RepID=UPI00189469F6|nr:DNA polymerase III subunit beta [Nocardia terpenica]MBF6060526.1 hypothetical protein [Nocardia terpenica]MBF6103786.1 hypothetical protein [Nocardia terpenica]MBF6111840.1 hypothetical protein [Nocardia terpenica]MBF6118007.1 hypothetical protein [Nocardia terpenica]MBF6155267.1 hypothetical protein [Nocardia terpenica]
MSAIEIDLKDLSTNLTFIKRVTTVGRRYGHPSLTLLRVAVSDGIAAIAFYDYETAVTVRMEATGDDCTFAVQLEELVNAVKAAGPKGTAVFSVHEKSLSLEVDGISIAAPLGEPAAVEDAPSVPAIDGEPALIVSGPEFSDAINALEVSRGNDDTLPMLTGVRLESDGARVDAVTTDRYKVTNARIPSASLPVEFEALLPGKPLAALGKRAVKESSVSVTLGGGDTVAIESDTVTLVLRKLDCQFPKWRQLFTMVDNASASFEVDAQSLAKRLKSLTASTLTVHLGITEEKVTLTGHSRDGDTVCTFVLDSGNLRVENSMVIAFNTGYLAQVLASVPRGAKVHCSFTKPNRPMLLEWNQTRTMLMPVRLPG